VGYLHSSKDLGPRSMEERSHLLHAYTSKTGTGTGTGKLQASALLGPFLMVDQFDGGLMAGGNLMLKCIYSRQMISKSDKDPSRNIAKRGKRRERERTQNQLEPRSQLQQNSIKFTAHSPFTVSRAEVASAPG